MADCVQTWRKKLRLQELIDIAKNKLESGTEITLYNKVKKRIV